MIRESDVRQKIVKVVEREISIPDFIRWIMGNDWNMRQDSSTSAVNLVSDIHLLLAERDYLSLDDTSFLQELSMLSQVSAETVGYISDTTVSRIEIEQVPSPRVKYVPRPLAPSSRWALTVTV